MGSGSFIEQSVRFARNLILVRILAPQAFGTMAIILSITSALESFTEVGSREALIQNPRGSEPEFIGMAWWLGITRALFLATVVFLAAPWISKFYHDQELTALLRVAASAILLNGAMSMRAVVVIREMRFSKLALIMHGGGIIGVLSALVAAFYIRNVWALVFGFCMEAGARCILSYIVCPFVPPLKYAHEALSELLKFSKGIFGLAFLNLIFARADIFVLAKLFSQNDLGLYATAIYLVQVPVGFVMNLLGQVFMPTFSETQKDAARTNRILLQVTAAIVLLGLPVIAFVSYCGHSILTIAYGARYSAAAPALVVAACVAVVNLLNGQITTVFYAQGVPSLHRHSVALTALSVVIFIYPMAKGFGLPGGQLPALMAISVGYIYQIWRLRTLTGLEFLRYAKVFVCPVLLTASLIALYFSTGPMHLWNKPILNLSLGASACLVAYGFGYLAFFRWGKLFPLSRSIS